MATIQHAAVAAGFMHALHDPETFAKWQAAYPDPAAVKKLIQDTLGLAQPPSDEDMEEMRKYAEANLQEEHARQAAVQTKAPRAVGYAYTMQS
jgi:hypothetical protein